MNSKLTLKLDTHTIESAKTYAAKKGESLSKLVENYFKALAGHEPTDSSMELTPIVKSISGIIKVEDYEMAKDSYADYLLNKYG
ncbi:MAG: DUF6364 family protein [Candidatus Peregrinibacteria bacterium]|nr:DUF6364 family protein [Candidatus Peregrinibacteria bacterium]